MESYTARPEKQKWDTLRALPDSYQDVFSYVKELCSFLFTYRWIYDFKKTELFYPESKWLERCSQWSDDEWFLTGRNEPDEMVSFFREFDVASTASDPGSSYGQPGDNREFRRFVRLCHRLSLSRKPCISSPVPQKRNEFMGAKKLYEVQHLGAFICDWSAEDGTDLVVDVGSGLGYLTRSLAADYGLDAVGVESERGRGQRAVQRHLAMQRNRGSRAERDDTQRIDHLGAAAGRADFDSEHSAGRACSVVDSRSEEDEVVNESFTSVSSTGENTTTCSPTRVRTCGAEGSTNEATITFTTWTLTESNIDAFIQKLSSAREDIAEKRVCLVGLHCCGDLTPTVVKLFIRCRFFSSLVLVSCCFHKMIPLSKNLPSMDHSNSGADNFSSTSYDVPIYASNGDIELQKFPSETSDNKHDLHCNCQESSGDQACDCLSRHRCEGGDQYNTGNQPSPGSSQLHDAGTVHCMDRLKMPSFNNFPMSHALGAVRTSVNELRLAAEASLEAWLDWPESRRRRGLTSAIYRALTELVVQHPTTSAKRRTLHPLRVNPRPTKKLPELFDECTLGNFLRYVQLAVSPQRTCAKRGSTAAVGECLDKMSHESFELTMEVVLRDAELVYRENEVKFPLVEKQHVLEMMIQPVLETMVLVDRAMFLIESGHENTGLVPIFDSRLSPRNLAIVCRK